MAVYRFVRWKMNCYNKYKSPTYIKTRMIPAKSEDVLS